MSTTLKKFVKGIILKGESSDISETIEGSLFSHSVDQRLKTYIQGAIRQIVTNSQVQTLTNKTIDADQNTITNIENADIKAAAAIDATKIANGSVSNTEFQYLDGVTSSIQTQITTNASNISNHTGASTNVHGVGVGNSVVGTGTSQSLTNKTIDADLNTISNIENADIKAGAAIDASKIADGSVSNAEFQYLDGVTSSIQTQLGARELLTNKATSLVSPDNTKYPTTQAVSTELALKQNSITGAASTITSSDLTVSRAVVSNSSGKIAVSTTTSTELGYVSGVTSAIQTQLNSKEDTITTLPISKGGTNSGTALNNNRVITSSGGAIVEAAAITASRSLVSDTNGLPVASTTTSTEIGYVSGVTSAIQTQLNGKESTITVLPISKGGTNSSTALLNNRITKTLSGAIVEADAITASRALVSDLNGIPTHSTVTSTELGYVSGTTSSIQTQLNGKEASITTLPISKGGTNSGTALNNNRIMTSSSGAIVEAAAITAARALISDANGIPAASTVTSTELGYVSGVTSAIQTQLDAKASSTSLTTHTGASSGVHGVTGSVVGTSDTQTLTNKTISTTLNTISGNFTGNGIITPSRLDVKQDTKANLTTYATTASNGQLAFATDTKQMFQVVDGVLVSVGSDTQSINYISNWGFEDSTTGWAVYKDTAATTPTDGTGGSSITTTLSRVTSSPLRGLASGVINKTNGGSRQGEGVSYDFTIAAADQAQILKISFDYSTSTNYADGDIRLYVYDVTNAQLIEVIDRDLYASLQGKYVGTFQTSSNSTSYRLIFHIASSVNNAWTVTLDNVTVGPQPIVKGAVVTDWQSYTPTWSGTTSNPTLGNGTISGKYRRIGDMLEVSIALAWGSTTSNGSGIWSFTLPNGLSVDTSSLSSGLYGTTNSPLQGSGFAIDSSASSARTVFVPYYNQSLSKVLFQTQGNTSLGDNVPFIPSSGDSYSFTFSVPILGWSSNVALSEDVGNRLVVTNVAQSFTQSLTDNTHTKIAFTSAITIENDTTASWDTTNHRYNVPETGFYSINGSVGFASTSVERNLIVSIYVDGVANKQAATRCLSSNTTLLEANHPCLYLTKGQYIELYAYQNDVASTTSLNATSGKLCIAKRSSPQTIAASEVVAFAAKQNSGQTVSSNTKLIYNVVNTDTHGAYDSTTGVYTVPVSGYYSVYGCYTVTFTPTTDINFLTCRIVIDSGSGDVQETESVTRTGTTTSTSFFASTSGVFYLAKGYKVAIQGSISVSSGLSTSSRANQFTILKV